jgi:hypothetical protein
VSAQVRALLYLAALANAVLEAVAEVERTTAGMLAHPWRPRLMRWLGRCRPEKKNRVLQEEEARRLAMAFRNAMNKQIKNMLSEAGLPSTGVPKHCLEHQRSSLHTALCRALACPVSFHCSGTVRTL